MKKFRISILILMIGTMISKFLGLAREVLLAEKYGTSYISDSFIISLNIPTVIISALATAILTNYIPLFSKIENESKESASKFNGNLISIFFIISIILIIIFNIFIKYIVKIFAIGFNETGLEYVINLSRVTILSIYFIVISHILKGYLEYKGRFLGTSLNGILLNIGMILGIVFSNENNYYILAFGVICGYILSFILLVILAIKNGFSAKINIDLKNNNLKKLIILTIPILLNDVIWQVNGIADKSIASTIGEGYISAINYSHYIVDIVSSIFATSIGTVLFPDIIKIFNEKGIKPVVEKMRTTIKYITFITIPCTILIMNYSELIVKILFFRGAFNEYSLKITSSSIIIYSVALFFVCMQVILFKLFYAIQDTKSPTKNAIISIIVNIILNVILSKIIGYKGIVMATVISAILLTYLLIKRFSQKYEKLYNKELLIYTIKIIIASIIMWFTIYLVNKGVLNLYFYNEILSEIIKAIICAVSGGVVYIMTVYAAKVKLR